MVHKLSFTANFQNEQYPKNISKPIQIKKNICSSVKNHKKIPVDHGLDSWSTVPFTITIFSIFGRGRFSISSVELLCVLISTQIVFFTTHWEKYNTGIMFLSWAYDVSQFVSFLFEKVKLRKNFEY